MKNEGVTFPGEVIPTSLEERKENKNGEGARGKEYHDTHTIRPQS